MFSVGILALMHLNSFHATKTLVHRLLIKEFPKSVLANERKVNSIISYAN